MNPIETLRRYQTLKTHRIRSLPIAILMPHSTCNCRCVMCDIWKDNANRRQLDEPALRMILEALKKLNTRLVVLSGGEALMHPRLFDFCAILRAANMKVTVLSSGLLLSRYAREIVDHTDEMIVSLDGAEEVHNAIRNIPEAYQKLRAGVKAIKILNPHFRISGRCVIQQLNFHDLPHIIRASQEIGLDKISFLAADVSSEAFNRPEEWGKTKKQEILLNRDQLTEFREILERVAREFTQEFSSGFIAESPKKLFRLHAYYEARLANRSFQSPFCTAPWVSAVVEADGSVRPCYFHRAYGNIFKTSLMDLLNSPEAISFRRDLDVPNNSICNNCVCSLHLRPFESVP